MNHERLLKITQKIAGLFCILLIGACSPEGAWDMLSRLSEDESVLAQEVNAIQKLAAWDAQAGDKFGTSVSIGGYAIVGAPNEDTGGANAGAAYIFHRTGTNTWDAGVKIVASDAQANDKFGRSVAISRDYAIVGADREDAGGSDAGAAYIFF